MIQIKENGQDDEILLSIRYKLESEEIARKISIELQKENVIHEVIYPSKSSSGKTIIVIDNLDSIKINPYFIKSLNERFRLEEKQFDFFFGITSGFQLGGFTLPSRVVDYLRIIGGVVQFSYSISFDETESE